MIMDRYPVLCFKLLTTWQYLTTLQAEFPLDNYISVNYVSVHRKVEHLLRLFVAAPKFYCTQRDNKLRCFRTIFSYEAKALHHQSLIE
jgi:hypothetical protein